MRYHLNASCYHDAFESHDVKVHEKNERQNDTTLLKNETHYKIIEEMRLERKENVETEIQQKITKPGTITAQSIFTEMQLNFSSTHQNIQEPKEEHTFQVDNRKKIDDYTTIRNDIKVLIEKICFSH